MKKHCSNRRMALGKPIVLLRKMLRPKRAESRPGHDGNGQLERRACRWL